MKLFLPSARATNYLLIVGFCSLGYALYLRYLAIEQSTSAWPAPPGSTPGCASSRRIAIALFTNSVFGMGRARSSPRSICCGRRWCCSRVALAAACFGIVLYNVALSALAVGLLVLSFARRAPEPD